MIRREGVATSTRNTWEEYFMHDVPQITLNNGSEMPQLGFGVYKVAPDEAEGAVRTALEAGYRSIDTAALYGNEDGVGRAVANSDIPREDLFITTKLWNDAHGYDETLRAFDDSLGKLGLDYLDLYLIHWPVPARNAYVETWKALEKLAAEGRCRAIGVSNFQIAHLRRLMEETDTLPAVNQIELHPNFQQGDLRAFHNEHDIATEAWAPLAKGRELLQNRLLVTMAEKYAKTPAQIVLRWHMQLGTIAIPKSATPSRVRENIDVFDFEIADDDLAEIAALETGERIGAHPDTVGS